MVFLYGHGIKITINPLTYIVWITLIVTGQTEFLLCSFVCAVLHEASHISAYLNYGASVFSLEILPFGISASIGKTDKLSCRHEILCAFFGPFMNLFLAAFFYCLSDYVIKDVEFFIYCNLSFFILNMLPVIPLDGGRILYFVLIRKFQVRTASAIMRVLSFTLTLIIFLAGCIIYILTCGNISVLLIGMYLFVYFFTSSDNF